MELELRVWARAYIWEWSAQGLYKGSTENRGTHPGGWWGARRLGHSWKPEELIKEEQGRGRQADKSNQGVASELWEKPWETQRKRAMNKQWSETSSAIEKLGRKSKFGIVGAWVVSVVGPIEEVRKWRWYFERQLFQEICLWKRHRAVTRLKGSN